MQPDLWGEECRRAWEAAKTMRSEPCAGWGGGGSIQNLVSAARLLQNKWLECTAGATRPVGRQAGCSVGTALRRLLKLALSPHTLVRRLPHPSSPLKPHCLPRIEICEDMCLSTSITTEPAVQDPPPPRMVTRKQQIIGNSIPGVQTKSSPGLVTGNEFQLGRGTGPTRWSTAPAMFQLVPVT